MIRLHPSLFLVGALLIASVDFTVAAQQQQLVMPADNLILGNPYQDVDCEKANSCNVALGLGAGINLTTGSRNTIIGRACQSLTTGNDNLCVGDGADLPPDAQGMLALPGGKVMPLSKADADEVRAELASVLRSICKRGAF